MAYLLSRSQHLFDISLLRLLVFAQKGNVSQAEPRLFDFSYGSVLRDPTH
jgi:hypothetical protein